MYLPVQAAVFPLESSRLLLLPKTRLRPGTLPECPPTRIPACLRDIGCRQWGHASLQPFLARTVKCCARQTPGCCDVVYTRERAACSARAASKAVLNIEQISIMGDHGRLKHRLDARGTMHTSCSPTHTHISARPRRAQALSDDSSTRTSHSEGRRQIPQVCLRSSSRTRPAPQVHRFARHCSIVANRKGITRVAG